MRLPVQHFKTTPVGLVGSRVKSRMQVSITRVTKKKDPVRVQVELCTFIRQGKVSLMSFTVTLRQSKRQKESGRKDRKIERPVISHFSELRC